MTEKVIVKFVGVFRNASGTSRFFVQLKGPSALREVIQKIVELLPNLEQALIDPELKDHKPNALILVNRKEISVLSGLETIVKDGDEVVFIPVSHGG